MSEIPTRPAAVPSHPAERSPAGPDLAPAEDAAPAQRPREPEPASREADARTEALLRERDRALAEAREARQRLALVFDQVPAALAVTRGPDHVFEAANPLFVRLAGGRGLVGRPAREALPALDGQPLVELLDEAYATGRPQRGRVDTVRTGEEPGAEPSQTCFDFVYQPLRDESGAVGGIVVHAVEVTQQILLLRQTTQQAEELATQRQQLEEQTALLQEQAAELEQQVAEAQENARQMEAANEALAASTEEARAAVQVAERERERAAAALEEEARLVGVLHRIGQTLASETGLQRIVQTATDEATALTGARFGAFFYNLVNERGESYTLYTLSGVPREAFSSFPMPRNTHVFGPTFRGEGVVRSGDITRDPRYGQNPPYHGMPPGHLPVRSYLAVPVVSRSGEVLGGLFFGHEQTEVFTERAERIATGIAGWAAVAMDNALLHEAERSARQEAEAANQAKSAFLATMSHELRTPLNAIGGYAQILEMGVRGPVTEAQRSDLERVIRAQEHLLGLINDVLNFAKLEAGRVEFEVRDVPVEEALAHVEELVAPQTAARGITYRRGASPEGACVRADLEKLQQVLLNLLSNAVKFTDPGGEITVWWETGRDGVRIHVSDTGIGIPPKKLDSIFEPFVQVDPDLTRTRQGTGLGLAISRELARGMGGDLAAASAPGEGSTFTLRLRAPA